MREPVLLSSDRAEVGRELVNYYSGLFMNDPALDEIRSFYPIHEMTLKSHEHTHLVAWLVMKPGRKN